MKRLALFALPALLLAHGPDADAFCGFYVSGADQALYNNATQVVLMREGTRTVLSMQNNYQGPPENFAMVVPVPVVLQEENVKTLPREVFKRVDQLAAPRLVEYWEQDPCYQPEYEMADMAGAGPPRPAPTGAASKADNLGVTIEAQFTVGEYQVVILSAKDSTGLDTWLKQEGYKIPDGAEPYLKPYVEQGSKFFVAKVDTSKVTFDAAGNATLSPLRFHYDSPEFNLPIRLGMINAKDAQDLIVHILARGKRYEVANYPNAFIPTNIDVKDETRKRFGEFYAALFDATLEKNPGAVVTEYSWDAGTCDPCPTPALSFSELATLGADIIDQPAAAPAARKPSAPGPTAGAPRPPSIRPPPPPPRRFPGRFVLTRLHVRYNAQQMKDDLVFKEAPAIMGGREVRTGPNNSLEEGAKPSGVNNFQGRYAIRHEWTGPIECENPVRGRWGGPPPGHSGSTGPTPAVDTAFAPRGKLQLAQMVAEDVPELKLVAAAGAPADPTTNPAKPPSSGDAPKSSKKKSGCGCATGDDVGGSLPSLALILAATVMMRRRRR